MKRLSLFLLILTFSCCFSRPLMMTRDSYQEITIGTPVNEVVAKAGEPVKVETKGRGIEQYEYVERVIVDDQIVYENRYYFIINNGRVVAKWSSQEKPSGYDFMYQPNPVDVEP